MSHRTYEGERERERESFRALWYSASAHCCSLAAGDRRRLLSGTAAGEDAAAEWKKNPRLVPKQEPVKLDKGDWFEKLASGIIAVVLMALLAA